MESAFTNSVETTSNIASNIFSVPVFGVEFSGISDLLGLEDIVRELCPSDREPWEVHQTSGTIHNDERLEPLCQRIISTVENISSNILKYDPNYKVEITSMWGNIQPPGASLHTHIHHNSLFAGCIYVNDISDEDGEFPAIQFLRPWKNQFNPSVIEPNVYNFSKAWVDGKKDLVVMFPSWLEHQVTRNLTDKDRVGIAFNIMLRGRYGNEGDLESTIF